jgi:hypothetical protein
MEMATELQNGRGKATRVPAVFVKDFVTRTQASLIQAGVCKSTHVLDYKFSGVKFLQHLMCPHHHAEHFFSFFDQCTRWLLLFFSREQKVLVLRPTLVVCIVIAVRYLLVEGTVVCELLDAISMACAARVGTDTDARIRSAMLGFLKRFLRTCTGRPRAYKPWGRQYGDKEYCEKRQQLLLTLGGLMLDQKASPNFDPCAMARVVRVKERVSADSQFGLMQIAMDLVFHPCGAERVRFHCVAPLYKTTLGGGLPAALDSLSCYAFRHPFGRRLQRAV